MLARSHHGECTWPLSPSLQHLSSPGDTDTQEKGRTSGIQALSRHESPAELSWCGSPSMQAPEGWVTSGNGWEQLPSWVCPLLSESKNTSCLKYFPLSPAKAATKAPPPGQPPTSSAEAPVSSVWSLAGVPVPPMKKLRLGKVTGSLQPMAGLCEAGPAQLCQVPTGYHSLVSAALPQAGTVTSFLPKEKLRPKEKKGFVLSHSARRGQHQARIHTSRLSSQHNPKHPCGPGAGDRTEHAQ